jgi:phosphoribosyl 1,2-cyclic phosphate phosphodiesterase
MKMNVTLLGTGTSVGVPMVGCPCEVCQSADEKDRRLRTSALIKIADKSILIDIGPDFREQGLRYQIDHIDAILLTHPHRDHIGGFDDIRALNFIHQKPIPLYANDYTWQSLKKQFYYAFENHEYSALPEVQFFRIENAPFFFENIEIIPIHVLHGSMPCLGYRIQDFVYITDCNKIPEAEFDKLKNVDTLVLNALRKTTHASHFSLDEAIHICRKINPKRVYFTHISHHMGFYRTIMKELPASMELGYDGMEIEL